MISNQPVKKVFCKFILFFSCRYTEVIIDRRPANCHDSFRIQPHYNSLSCSFIDFHADKIPNEAASRQFRCGLWRVFIVDFGAIPLWTFENPSFHALDAAEIHPYETAAWPCGPEALKAAKRRFNHLKAEGRLKLALPYLYQTFQRQRPRPGAVSTRAVRGAAAVRSSVTAAGFSLPLPTLRRKPTIERTCL